VAAGWLCGRFRAQPRPALVPAFKIRLELLSEVRDEIGRLRAKSDSLRSPPPPRGGNSVTLARVGYACPAMRRQSDEHGPSLSGGFGPGR
jgi:hypothetical protein